MTDDIYNNLYGQTPPGAEYSVGRANIGRVNGKNIVADNNDIQFGLYASGPINTNLQPNDDFVINEFL